jgi:hypothetical protein
VGMSAVAGAAIATDGQQRGLRPRSPP